MRGQVSKDGSGRWFFRFSVGSGDTRRHITRRGFPTKKAADTALSEALTAAGRGDLASLTAPSSVTVSEYLDQWLAARTGIKVTTADSYRTIIRGWIVPTLGELPLKSLTGARIARWHTTLAASGGRGGRPLSQQSVTLAWRVLSMALSDAVESRQLGHNPGLDIPRRQRPTASTKQQLGKVWTEEEARTFLTATADDRLSALWRLLLSTGCRRGEAIALRWADVDLTDAVATLTHNRVPLNSGGIAETTLKNGKPRRVDLAPQTIAALRSWRAAVARERLAAGTAYQDSGYVFIDQLGAPLTPGAVSERFKRLVAKAGVPPVSIHACRHTAGTIMLGRGVPVHVTASVLGHDASVLLKLYAHVLPSSTRDAAKIIGEALGG